MQNLYDLIQEYNSKVRELEQRKRELYDAIREAISCVSLPGVTKISGNTAYVSISSIVSSKGYILSPEYYHSGRQAELVKRYLESAKTPETLKTKVQNMVDRGFVEVNGTKHLLNNSTLAVLKSFV